MKKSILNSLGQVLLIVFSVVLGLYLSERIEDRKNELEANKLLQKIKSELVNNKEILAYWVPYHEEILYKVDSLSGNEEFIEEFIRDKSALFEKVLTRGTFMGAAPSNDAWDIAKAHPLIVNLEYEELLIISKIYNQQKSTFEPSGKISDLFFSGSVNKRENAKENLEKFRNLLREIVSREFDLVSYYNEGYEILDLKNKN